jgi:hypothetical protein
MTGVTPAGAVFAERAASAIRIGFIGYLIASLPQCSSTGEKKSAIPIAGKITTVSTLA